jgi:hypothetical protein
MAMEDEPNLVGIIVNPADYVLGATAGGEVSLFDFFDIDYNKQKYLIETRCSGALVKMKSALIIRSVCVLRIRSLLLLLLRSMVRISRLLTPPVLFTRTPIPMLS